MALGIVNEDFVLQETEDSRTPDDSMANDFIQTPETNADHGTS